MSSFPINIHTNNAYIYLDFEILQAIPLDIELTPILQFKVKVIGTDSYILHNKQLVAQAKTILSDLSLVLQPQPHATKSTTTTTTTIKEEIEALILDKSNQHLDGLSLYNHFKR